jgi:hypothetical protein
MAVEDAYEADLRTSTVKRLKALEATLAKHGPSLPARSGLLLKQAIRHQQRPVKVAKLRGLEAPPCRLPIVTSASACAIRAALDLAALELRELRIAARGPCGDVVVLEERALRATFAWGAPIESAEEMSRRWPIASLSRYWSRRRLESSREGTRRGTGPTLLTAPTN